MKRMKRLLALLVLGMMILTVTARAEDYVSVRELYEETRAPWQAAYYFPNSGDYAALGSNYSFSVDVTPDVPDIERFPILRVKMRPIELTEEEMSRFYQDENAQQRQSFAESRALGYAVLKTGGILDGYPWADFFWNVYDEMDAARDNPLTPEDAAGIALGLWQKYLRMDNIRVRGVVGYDRVPRPYGEYSDLDVATYTMDKGAYTVVGEALLGGVPLLDASRIWPEDGPYYPQVVWEITLKDEDRFFFQGSAVEMVEELMEDVPLLPFARIREIYESTLGAKAEEQGKPMIDVLSAELGYLLLAEHEAGADTVYITKPVWILRGYRPEGLWGGEKVRAMTVAQEENMRQHPRGIEVGLFMHTQYMCLDAQTGEVLNWPNLGQDYYEESLDVLTWEGR